MHSETGDSAPARAEDTRPQSYWGLVHAWDGRRRPEFIAAVAALADAHLGATHIHTVAPGGFDFGPATTGFIRLYRCASRPSSREFELADPADVAVDSSHRVRWGATRPDVIEFFCIDESTVQTVEPGSPEVLAFEAAVADAFQPVDWDLYGEAPAVLHRGRASDDKHAKTVDMSAAACEARERIASERRSLVRGQKGMRGSGQWTCFFHVAREMTAAGWRVFPQNYQYNRSPGPGVRPSEFRNAPVAKSELDYWLRSEKHLGLNTAVLTGQASGGLVVLDVDISTDPAASIESERMIEKVLGPTDYKRLGSSPKIALCYRLDRPSTKEEYAELIKSPINLGGGDQIELLSDGKQITTHGLHHKTTDRFVWTNDIAEISPAELPAISHDQLRLLRWYFANKMTLAHAKSGGAAFAVEDLPEDVGDIRVPVLKDYPRNGAGLIDDAREKYAHSLCWNLIRANPASEYSDADHDRLTAAALKAFKANCLMEGARWGSDEAVARELRERVIRFGQKMAAGEMTPTRRTQVAPGLLSTTAIREPVKPVDRFRDETGAFAWLLGDKPFESPAPGGVAKVQPVVKTAEAVEADRKTRALLSELERSPHHRAVQDAIAAGFASFMSDARKRSKALAKLGNMSEGRRRRAISALDAGKAYLVKAVAGGGKTTRVAAALVDDLTRDPLPRGQKIVVHLNDYALGEELLATYARLGAKIVRSSDTVAPDWKTGDAPLVGLFEGRSRLTCRRAELMEPLRKAGLAGSGLCSATVQLSPQEAERQGRKTETVECPYKNHADPTQRCVFYRQADVMAGCQIVVSMSSWLTISSEFLNKNTVAIITDEDQTLRLLKSHTLFDDDLGLTRGGRVTKALAAQGLDFDALESHRRVAIRVALGALKAGRCPSEALFNFRDGDVDGRVCLDAAIAACRRRDPGSQELTPRSSLQDVLRIVQMPTICPGMAAELAFWQVVEERWPVVNRWSLERTCHIRKGGRPEAFRPLEIDPRIQRVMRHRQGSPLAVEPATRISKRITPKFAGLPLLALDASASVQRLQKTFGRETEVFEADCPPHLRVLLDPTRTYANSDFIITESDGPEARAAKRALIRDVRLLITLAAAEHPDSRILVTLSREVRRRVNARHWRCPDNVDFLHFGAVRGRDFAKNHVGVISIGRMQLPIGDVDAEGAACGWDDATPYRPFDIRGDGFKEVIGENGETHLEPLFRDREIRTFRMRSGEDFQVAVPQLPAGWARDIDHARRENELSQTAARMRPAYRNGDQTPPWWICLGVSLPDTYVVDAVARLSTMVKGSELPEAARKAGLLTAPVGFAEIDNSLRDESPLPDAVIRGEYELFVELSAAAFPEVDLMQAVEWLRQRWERLARLRALPGDRQEMIDEVERAHPSADAEYLTQVDRYLSGMEEMIPAETPPLAPELDEVEERETEGA